MIIRAEILKKATGEKIIVEKKGANRVATLLSFYKDSRRYANKEHSLLKVSSDDATVLAEISSKSPSTLLDYIDPEKKEATQIKNEKPIS